ncbi:MAG: hypothetical protein M3Y84_08825 [Acidobacteriota bacterium]|nr:hypothetical protein [Acidobacteriota bacterium]
MTNLSIEIPAALVEQIAQKVLERVSSETRPVVHDAEAEEISRKLQRIGAKMFITIPELCFLFNCSAGYVGKLLERAQKQETAHPVPHLNLDGLIQFDREEVLKWAATIKPLGKSQRKTGGKRQSSHLREVVNR